MFVAEGLYETIMTHEYKPVGGYPLLLIISVC